MAASNYSNLMLAAFTTVAQRCVSARMRAVSSSAELPTATPFKAFTFDLKSSEATSCRLAVSSFLTIGAGVWAGAISANQVCATTSLIPASASVGTFGRSGSRGGTVTVRTPAFEAVHRELSARDVICDFRPESGLRLGPHFFTTDDELRHAVEEIVDIVESRAYERHVGTAARY